MRNWAIVVGINAYPAASRQTELKGAVADAADFADWALHPNGGGVAPEDLFFWTHPAPAQPSAALSTFLTSPSPWADAANEEEDGEPVKLHPMAQGRPPRTPEIALTALAAARVAKATRTENRLYVFLAGHGLQTTTIESAQAAQTCFVTAEFKPESPIALGLLPCDDLRNGLLALGFTQVVMFLDCCRAQITPSTTPPSLAMMRAVQGAKRNYGVGRAADFGAVAFEAPAADPQRGAFSKVLLDGLRRHRDDNQTLTLNGLESYVETAIIEVVAPEKQYPQFDISPRNPKFPLLTAPPIDPDVDIEITFTADYPVVELRDGKARLIRTFTGVTRGQALQVPLPAGAFYSLETPDKKKASAFQHSGPEVTHESF